MNKIITGAVMALLFVPVIALAAGPNGPSGNSKMSHLYLYEKNPADWTIVDDGAWGKLNYDTDSFVFNGHGLTADTEYTLVRYYGTTWPTIECLASGTSNNGGNINLEGAIGSYGDKVWLVLTADTNCDSYANAMTAWNPTEYIFEDALI